MRDLIASHAPLRGGRHTARQNGPKHYPGDSTGAANRGPAKAQRSGFGGERRSSGTTELLPLKAKRRMWSLRRRGTPFSPIFRRATKDGATGGRQLPNAAGKNAKQNDCAPEGCWNSREVGKNVQRKMGPSETVGCRTRPVNPHDLKPTHSYLFNILYSIFFPCPNLGRNIIVDRYLSVLLDILGDF